MEKKWEPLPSGIIKGITTPLFTFPDKLRLLGEPFRKKGENPNETLADLVLRRMGKSFLDYAIDPFILGIYSGDPAKLVTKFAFPKLYRLEQDYGSFIKGALKKAKEPKTEREKKATKEIFSV
jgi:protoporphyrinogen/coproporphyrinogen III oxidase